MSDRTLNRLKFLSDEFRLTNNLVYAQIIDNGIMMIEDLERQLEMKTTLLQQKTDMLNALKSSQ